TVSRRLLEPDFPVELDVEAQFPYRERHRGWEGLVPLQFSVRHRLLHRFLDRELGVDAHGLQKFADAHVKGFVVHFFLRCCFLRWPIRPLVELSCVETGPRAASSGSIRPASCLPSSTPHWSKALISQITDSTNTLCS